MDGKFVPENQVIQAMPLFFGLVPEANRKEVELTLHNTASSRQIRSGEIGLRFLIGALSATKRNDIVFDMMMQPEHPSYIRFVEKGETSLPEFWTDDARSRNHDMMGHILEWLYKELLGISSISGAYKEIRIAPYLCEKLHHVHGKYHSVRGLIEVDFSHSKEKVSLSVSIPANTTAQVRIPILGIGALVLENGYPISHDVVYEGGYYYTIVRVGSGRYQFESSTAV